MIFLVGLYKILQKNQAMHQLNRKEREREYVENDAVEEFKHIC